MKRNGENKVWTIVIVLNIFSDENKMQTIVILLNQVHKIFATV